jgi:hypothetical protein
MRPGGAPTPRPHPSAPAVSPFLLPHPPTRQLVELSGAHVLLSPLEELVLLVAAICHDIDHDGRSNSYHVNAHSELAQRYNDRSGGVGVGVGVGVGGVGVGGGRGVGGGGEARWRGHGGRQGSARLAGCWLAPCRCGHGAGVRAPSRPACGPQLEPPPPLCRPQCKRTTTAP